MVSTDDPDSGWLRTEAAARHLGMSRRQLDRLRGRSEGPPYFKLSEQSRRYRVADLDAWLESVRQVPGGD